VTLAFVFAECEEGQTSAAKTSLDKVQGVKEAYYVSGGGFDLLLEVHSNDEQSLNGVLGAIKCIRGIASLATSIVCRNLLEKESEMEHATKASSSPEAMRQLA
jgi:DNA-binding Lrp family transcriptional regulator